MPEALLKFPQVLPPDSPPPELPPALFKIPGAVLSAALAAQFPPGESAVGHLFADGACARILRMKACTLATARRHQRSHICVLLEGEMTVWEDGKEEWVALAGTAWVAQAGTEYRGYVHEDAAWLTFFPNPDNGTDTEAILDREEAVPAPALPAGPLPNLKELLP